MQAKDPLMKFWAEEIYCVNYLLSQILTREICHVIPIEKWCGKKPFVGDLKTFGCVSWAHILDDFRKNLDANSRKPIDCLI